MKDRIIREFGLKPFGRKGWFGNSVHFICPVCQEYDKIGVFFSKEGGRVHCFHENHYNKPLNSYLREIGRQDLVEIRQESISINRNIKDLFTGDENLRAKRDLPQKSLPIGFKCVDYDEYLEERGFLPSHWEEFKPGVTSIDLRQKNNIVFQIFDLRGVRVGWLSRSKMSKEWHKQNLRRSKLGQEPLKLRYDNSPNTEFNRMLGGIREVTDNTHTLYLVEGLFDKTNVDIQYRLDLSEERKCLFTFGDSISLDQIELIKGFKGIRNVYLLYDYNTINNSKQYGMTIQSELRCNVRVCEIKQEGKDPGNMLASELDEVVSQSVSALGFKIGKLSYV